MLVPVWNWDEVSSEAGPYPFKVDADKSAEEILKQINLYISDSTDEMGCIAHYVMQGSGLTCVVGLFGHDMAFAFANWWGNNAKTAKQVAEYLESHELNTNGGELVKTVAKDISKIIKAETVKKGENIESVYEIGDKFEELINNGKMEWREGTIDDLPEASAYVLDMIGDMKWLVGEPKIGNNVVLKLDDEYIQYVDLFSNGKFMFCTDNHHAGIHPRDVSTRLLVTKEKDKNKRKQIRDVANTLWPKEDDSKSLMKPNKPIDFGPSTEDV